VPTNIISDTYELKQFKKQQYKMQFNIKRQVLIYKNSYYCVCCM